MIQFSKSTFELVKIDSFQKFFTGKDLKISVHQRNQFYMMIQFAKIT